MGEGFDQSTERIPDLIPDLIYIVTHNGLVETTQSPEDALADYGGMQLTGEIEWFRIFKVGKLYEDRELNILYSWGDMGKYHLSYARRSKLDVAEQWAIQWRGRHTQGEQYFPEEHHMWLILLSLLNTDSSIGIVAWRISQKELRRESLGPRFSTRHHLIARVNHMRAFFE